MLYCRAAGALLLLLCGVLLGGGLVAFEQRRCRQAAGFVSLLRHIRVQIDCFSLPVAGVLGSCDAQILCDCGVQAQRLTDLNALLEDTPLYLPQEMCRLLREFAASLGGSYRAEQLRCCDRFLEQLAPMAQRMQSELVKRTKTVLILPIAAAGATVLLLL